MPKICKKGKHMNPPVKGKASRYDFPKEVLYRLYVEEKRAPFEIASVFNVSVSYVHHRLKAYDIPRRTASQEQARRRALKEPRTEPAKIKKACIWDVFDDEAEQNRRIDAKIRNARSA